jgi:hypothetical protein
VTCPFARIGLVALALAAAPWNVAAQSVLCDTIKVGDTASSVAKRPTGSMDNVQKPWFRIVDPAGSKLIGKASYDRILVGWQVCIPAARLGPQPSRVSPTGTSGGGDAVELPFDGSQSTQQLIAGVPNEVPDTLKLALVLIGPVVFGAVIGFAWQGVERFLMVRRSLKREVQYFGDLFVKNFERPLVIDGVISRPIRARLRWVSFNRRLDILLAPAAGRRYPNLDDHRRNVEYDVERISQRLRHHPFVRRPLRAEGEWVVVPFQLKPRPRTGDPI